ncbi:hypothetical protein VC83_04384 [Pseudogymnoascus destructans]|uniref:Uncharacterized protein n=1 Tax=Pseudogymnoascus destructans TaxID=655981 RepID=A0A177ADB9_9PEZI|nr:uncharacterized protein VC83_04384 [Pseudogymnoascus destructans]OAF59174.1 hypothetical protein VC83_04384 [Pseudogymnoascus destructans]
MAKIHREGVTLLSESEDASGDQRDLNVIFIHGLKGHPRETCKDTDPRTDKHRNIKTYLGLQKNKKETDDKTQTRSFSPSDIFWPEEYLVPDLPQARIWTYGYNADVIGGLFQANNQNSISQHGRDFAVRLERDIDNEDPIVFVAHSLGGIITKDIGDNLQTDKADCLSWDTTSRKHILEVNDEVLDNIQDEFKTILSNCAIKVHSFQEAKGISGMKGLDSKVVDNFSSKLDLAREQETVETIDVNHMEMARCGSRDDVCYRQICGVLKQFIRETNSANNNSLAKQFIVPFPQDKHFVGREDILGQLDLGGEQEEPKKHQRHALVGLGGVGKSQIAIEYAYRARKCQPQISVFWIQASTKTRFEQAYKEMAERLEIPGRDNPKANVLQLVYNWLSDEANGQWHMILDNVDDGTNDLVNTFGKLVLVEPMKEKDSVDLLKTKIPVDKCSEADLKELAQALEGIPLAITHAAAYIRSRPRVTVSMYLSLFRESEANQATLLNNNETKDLRRDHSIRHAVITTWQITFEQIRKTSPEAAELLSLMAMFERQGIPESVLYDGRGRLQFEDAVALLTSFSLIKAQSTKQPEQQVGEYIFQMHELVQLATKKWLEVQMQVGRWQKASLHIMAAAFPSGQHETWAACRVLLPHARKVLGYVLEETEATLDRVRIADNTVRYLLLTGEYAAAEQIGRTAVVGREGVLGVEHPDTLISVSQLGLVLSRQGKYKEAEAMHQRALQGMEKVLGVEHPDTLSGVSQLGLVLERQGKYKEAEAMERRALGGREKVLGVEHPDTLSGVSNLGSVLSRQGKYEEAEAMERRALGGREKVLGVEHPDTLISVSQLGLVLSRQGKYEEAEAMHQRALQGMEKILGEEHPDTLSSVSNLGSVLSRQGKYEEAEAMHWRALQGMEKMLGVEHPDTLNGVSNLGSALEGQGKYKEAEAMHQRALQGMEKMLGVEHPDTLSSMANLASMYCEQSRWDEAEELQVQVIVTRKRVLGTEHQDTLSSIVNLASTYRNQGRWKEAEELEMQVIDMSSSVASDDEDIRSTVETESALSPLRVAAAWLIAKRFSEDQELFTLYRLALKRLGVTKFIRNNRRLLKSYYLCLKAEAQTTPEDKLVVSFLRLRATRTQISSYIYRILMPETFELEEKAPSTDEMEYSINRYLQSTETNSELMVEDPLRNDDFERDPSSDEDGVEDGDDDGDDISVDSAVHDVTHAHLRKAAQILTTGQPFNSYRNNLHTFVFSKVILGPIQTHTEVQESPGSQKNQGQDSQGIQNVDDHQGDPTTTLVSGNNPADHISWNDSETLFSRSRITPIKGLHKEPYHFGTALVVVAFQRIIPHLDLLQQHFQLQLIQAGYQARILVWSLEVVNAPVTLHALNDDKEQHIELPKTPSPLQPHQHIVSSTTITPDLQSSASGQTAQDPHSEIHPRTEIDHEQTLGKVEESQSRSIMSPSDQWLLLCFYHNNHVSKAVHMEVGEDPYDDELLLSFKKEYIAARGWATYFLSWTAVTDIRFVRKFLLIREDNSSFDYDVEDDLDVGRAQSDLVDLALLQEEWGPPAEWSERHAWAPCPADPQPRPQGKWIMHLWDKPHSSSTWLASKRLQRLCKSKVKLLWTAFNWKGKIKRLWINFRLFRGISVLASVPNSRDDIELQDVVVEIPPLPSIQARARQQRTNSPEKGRFFVNNTPKRLEQRLKADPTTPPYGWGLFFEENLVVPWLGGQCKDIEMGQKSKCIRPIYSYSTFVGLDTFSGYFWSLIMLEKDMEAETIHQGER